MTGIRIVGGALGGRKLQAPADRSIRPTSERTREALFDILRHGRNMPGRAPPLPEAAAVLDAFAGTGALGIEALSRGAASAHFLDSDPKAMALIRGNLRRLGLETRGSLVPRDALAPGRAPAAADLLLLDPPYRSGLAAPALQALAAAGWLRPGAVAAVELAKAEPLVPPEGFALLDERRYGAARLVFLGWRPR